MVKWLNGKYWSLVIVVLLTPIAMIAISRILPTFDDWTSLIAPSFGELFSKERLLFYGYHWRPFDATIGYIVGLNPHLLFPLLNHICVVVGHVGCTLMVWKLCGILKIDAFSKNIATLFFFLTPAMLATTLAVDGLNQTYANFWGLLSAWVYLKVKSEELRVKSYKYVIWLLLIAIATLCKENGLMWALVAPLLAFGFQQLTTKKLIRELFIGGSMFVVYALFVVLLPSNIIIEPEYMPGVMKTLHNIVKFIFASWVTVDSVWLLHESYRNLMLAAVTFVLSLPFIYLLFFRNWRKLLSRPFLVLLLCQLILVAPHLGTVFSMMHAYAGLGMSALMIGWLCQFCKQQKHVLWAYMLLILSFLVIDVHLWYESYVSSLAGRDMAQQAIEKTGTPVDKVFVVTVEDDVKKLSSFCVSPCDAFGWGLSVQYATNYEWPTEIGDTIVASDANEAMLTEIAHDALKRGFDCVWIVNKTNIEVVR